MTPGSPRRQLRRGLVALLALCTAVALSAVAATAPASAAPAKTKLTPNNSPTKKEAHPTKQWCAANNKPGTARCYAVKRTDIKSHGKGVQPNETPDGYGPTDLHSAYNLPTDAAAGTTVAIVDAFNNPNAESDLAVYRAQYGLPACTTDNGCFKKVNQEGVEGNYPPDDQIGWAGEMAIDIDMVSAVCPQCHILLVESDDDYTDNLAASVDTAVTLGALYVSNSYGGSEDPSQTDFDNDYNHPGVVVTASTGDHGYMTSYPATAPGVTAVGGTSLVADSSTRGWTESAWAGAGSGCSSVTAKPDFQTDPDCANKAIGDVSAIADPQTGVAAYNTWLDSGWGVWGGTSVSSPIIASVYALAGTPVAGSNPESYPYEHTSDLNDVTTGSNGSCAVSYLCHAGPGYDGPTGLGTPNGVAAFSSGPHGVVSGTVTDSATGNAIAGAQVTAGTASAVTAANGTYTLNVPTGTYDVVASAYGYASITRSNVVVGDGATITENFALVSVPKVALSGTVTDGSGHAWPLYSKITVDGVPGAPVYSDPFTGHYELQLPSKSTYSVHVEPVYPGYTPSTTSVQLGSANVVKNVAVKVADSCTAPGYTTKYSNPVEHFDTTIPSTWTVKDDNGSGGVWTTDDAGSRGNLTGGSGKFAIIDSDHLGTGKTQNTELITPVFNLSNDAAPVVGLNSYYKPYSNSVADIDYTVDGGTTWTNLSHWTTASQQGPLSIALPGAANKPAVQVRFHYTGTYAYYWEVDDVFVGHKSCATVPGGIVAGYTKDGNTKTALNGVTVTSVDVPADAGVSSPTPDDAAHPDGFYWLFSSVTGAHKFTASASRYASKTASVAVGANFVTRKDFTLAAGQIEASPGSIAATVVLGGSAQASVTLKNTGTQPVHVKLGETDGGFQIAGKPAVKAYQGVKGAPVKNVPGKYSPLRQKVSKSTAQPKLTGTPSDAPWTAIADLPTPISNNSASFNDGTLYTVGGFTGEEDSADLYAYDPTAKAWTKLAAMSVARQAPSSAWINGKLYVAGGWDDAGNPVATTEVYNPTANSWSTLADNPKPHAGAGSAVLGGQLYVFGGCDATCGSTDVQVYNPAGDSWSSATAYPEATAWNACGGIAGTVYCAGGAADATSAHTYSFDGTTWTPLADMPTDDWGAAYSVANGHLVVSGGVINNSAAVTNEGWSFDPAAGTWSALPNSNNSFYRLGGACGFYKVGGQVSTQDQAHVEGEVLPGYDSCDAAGADVAWLSEQPTETDIAAGASATVAVTMDSAVLSQPGTYKAAITVSTDTPYKVNPIQVTLTVTPPKTWGKITGVVTGSPCSGTAAPLAGATVQIDTWAASYTLTTDQDGRYTLWLDKRNNPLTVIVAKDGWQPQTRQAKVVPGAPLTSNFTLKPAKACQ